MEQEPRVVGHPVVGQHLRRHRVDVLDITRQPGAGEGFLHDPAVEHVLVEVEQHQPALEERPDDRIPGALRELLVAVGEDGLRRVGTQRHAPSTARVSC